MKLILKTHVKEADPDIQQEAMPPKPVIKKARKPRIPKRPPPPPSVADNLLKSLRTIGTGMKAWMLHGTIQKAHVKSYQRTSKTGQAVQVKEHDDKRQAARARFKKPRARAAGKEGKGRSRAQAQQTGPSEGPPAAQDQQGQARDQQTDSQDGQGLLPAFKPIPHPTTEEEVGPWLEAVMKEPDIVQAIQANTSGTPTEQIHKQADGSYTPERQHMHQAIVASMLNPKAQAAEGAKPHAVILMGCPGAGKTSTLAPMTQEFGVEFTTVNADDVKAKLPEYTGANAALVHEESSDIAEGQLFPQALQARHNLVMDITGSNGEKVKNMVEHFHNAGYEISLAYAHLPAWKAATRVVDRFRSSGRFVPPSYVVNQVDGNPEETYEQLKNDTRVSHYRRYSTDVTKNTPASLQETGRRDDRSQAQSSQGQSVHSDPGRQFGKALHRRAVSPDGGAAHGQYPGELPEPIRKALRLHGSLTKSVIYLGDDMRSPDLDAKSRGVLAAERLRCLDQLDALNEALARCGYESRA